MASTTVPTSFEQLSMITLRLRSSCINSLSVSSPLSSGINTSKIMKSGRSPPFTLAIASRPELTASTSKPSTSSSVCKYFRMLGSSSTTRIFSFAPIDFLPELPISNRMEFLALIHRQQERKPASRNWFAFHPDLASVGLDEPLSNRQPQAHACRVAVYPHKIFEDFLVMFRGNSRATVGHVHLDAVRTRQTKPSPLLDRRHLGYASFPKVRCRAKRNRASGGGMLQCVVQKVRRGLLYFLIVKLEVWYRGIERRVEFHTFSLKRLRPTFRQLVQTVAKVIFPKLQY